MPEYIGQWNYNLSISLIPAESYIESITDNSKFLQKIKGPEISWTYPGYAASQLALWSPHLILYQHQKYASVLEAVRVWYAGQD